MSLPTSADQTTFVPGNIYQYFRPDYQAKVAEAAKALRKGMITVLDNHWNEQIVERTTNPLEQHEAIMRLSDLLTPFLRSITFTYSDAELREMHSGRQLVAYDSSFPGYNPASATRRFGIRVSPGTPNIHNAVKTAVEQGIDSTLEMFERRLVGLSDADTEITTIKVRDLTGCIVDVVDTRITGKPFMLR